MKTAQQWQDELVGETSVESILAIQTDALVEAMRIASNYKKARIEAVEELKDVICNLQPAPKPIDLEARIARLRKIAQQRMTQPLLTLAPEDATDILAVCDAAEQAQYEGKTAPKQDESEHWENVVDKLNHQLWKEYHDKGSNVTTWRCLALNLIDEQKKRAEQAEAENIVAWHEAAILIGQNRDAKLKERDQLKAELATAKSDKRQIQAAALRELLDKADKDNVRLPRLWIEAEAARVEKGTNEML